MSMGIIITSVYGIIIAFSMVMLVKNDNTYNNMMKITEAIHSYNIHKLHEAIGTLFDNKDEILEAKISLESAVEKAREAKEDKEELLENIKDILSL